VLQGIVNNVLVPFAPMLQQQGISINFEAFLKKLARYANIGEDLDDVLIFTGMPQEDSAIVGESPRMPSATTRTNVRVNRPGATQANADNALSQLLMGAKMQPAEAEAAVRQVG
jgi:hypothetical protein